MNANNTVIFQAFHWYLPADGKWWSKIARRAERLAKAGFNAAWLPPASKGSAGLQDVGYGVYDLYDLGEFDQKGSIPTKYGTRRQYQRAIKRLQKLGLHVYADIVLNHRLGADSEETVRAIPYHTEDRLKPTGEAQEVKVFTNFTFPGRKQKYSSFEWKHEHFDATDYDGNQPDRHDTIWLFEGKQFDSGTSLEFGNYDYLMGCDLDFENPIVREELINWGRWFVTTTGVNGFRLDAVKHIPVWFFPEWLEEMEKTAKCDIFTVGEYWSHKIEDLVDYLGSSHPKMKLFDVPLHGHFHNASKAREGYDLRTILDSTLVRIMPDHAVTFVSNHDSQALQALEAVVEPWFKPLAYAIILLRQDGYPCVFFPDYYGAKYEDKGKDGNSYSIVMPSHRRLINLMLKIRTKYFYGEQEDYFNHQNCIGWVRRGDEQHPGTLAVVLSNAGKMTTRMHTGKTSTTYIDATKHISHQVQTDSDGWADFPSKAYSLAIWVEKEDNAL